VVFFAFLEFLSLTSAKLARFLFSPAEKFGLFARYYSGLPFAPNVCLGNEAGNVPQMRSFTGFLKN